MPSASKAPANPQDELQNFFTTNGHLVWQGELICAPENFPKANEPLDLSLLSLANVRLILNPVYMDHSFLIKCAHKTPKNVVITAETDMNRDRDGVNNAIDVFITQSSTDCANQRDNLPKHGYIFYDNKTRAIAFANVMIPVPESTRTFGSPSAASDNLISAFACLINSFTSAACAPRDLSIPCQFVV